MKLLQYMREKPIESEPSLVKYYFFIQSVEQSKGQIFLFSELIIWINK